MIVTVEQVKIGVVNFISQEICKRASGGKKWLYCAGAEIAPYYIQHYVDKAYNDPVLGKKFFDENGNVQLDEVYGIAKRSAEKSGQFIAFGLILNETDIDKVYHYIQSTTA